MISGVPRLGFGILRGREVGGFEGGDISSDGGLTLPGEVEAKTGLSAGPVAAHPCTHKPAISTTNRPLIRDGESWARDG